MPWCLFEAREREITGRRPALRALLGRWLVVGQVPHAPYEVLASVPGGTRGEAEETARHILGRDLLPRERSAPLSCVKTSVGQKG